MSNPYTALKEAASKFADKAFAPRTRFGGAWKKDVAINQEDLKSQVKAAASIGYRAEIRVEEGGILGLYFVERLPNRPYRF